MFQKSVIKWNLYIKVTVIWSQFGHVTYNQIFVNHTRQFAGIEKTGKEISCFLPYSLILSNVILYGSVCAKLDAKEGVCDRT